MPYNTIIVNSSALTTSGDVLMKATPTSAIEDRRFPRRFYNFNMIINNPFTVSELNARLTLTDNLNTNIYALIDRLNKPVTALELQRYASFRRCIACQFDSVQNTIRILSCLCPSQRFLHEWEEPTTAKDPVTTDVASDTDDTEN